MPTLQSSITKQICKTIFVQKRIVPIAAVAVIIFSLIGWACTKLDTTDIGSDLLPAVDNIHTFDTILAINSTQGLFNDSTVYSSSDDFALGIINNDPLFGRTNANIYMQLKPPFYPYYFGNPNDTLLGVDSVVLCLKYKGFWGDSSLPVHLDVKEVIDYEFRDSVYALHTTAYKPSTGGVILGSTDVDVRTISNYIKFTNRRDSVKNQVRIKLSAAWASQLFGRDSTAANFLNNAFYNDSIYRRFYNGLAVLASGGGNGLIYTNLADTATKIEIHYRRRNAGVVDTVYSSFRLYTNSSPTASIFPSNTGQHIVRNRAGYPVSNPASTEHYLQTSPGSYVYLKIPGLAGLSNRIIHRAELIVEQVPTNPVTDEMFSAPNFLYLDLKDTGANNYFKPVYFDLNRSQLYDPDYKTTIPYIANPIDYQYYGGYRRSKYDAFGNLIKYYNFNISRYIQHVVTDHYPGYDMRLYAPYNINYYQYSTSYIPYSNNMAYGRVRIGSGTNPNYRLRLRIVYSKL
jgi:hypothetical protein